MHPTTSAGTPGERVERVERRRKRTSKEGSTTRGAARRETSGISSNCHKSKEIMRYIYVVAFAISDVNVAMLLSSAGQTLDGHRRRTIERRVAGPGAIRLQDIRDH